MKNLVDLKKTVMTISTVVGILFLTNISGNAQMHGNHNGRHHKVDWPDSLDTITVSGTARVDTAHLHLLYSLDEGGIGSIDYQLGFGPYWYEPESGAARPEDSAEITITGGLIQDHTPPLIVVFEINGLFWRDSTGAPPWSGGWVHSNASDTTFIFCPTDSMDWIGYPPQSMQGMMFPDSMYSQFEETYPDSLPGMMDSSVFEGYYTENFSGHGNHMGGSGMMMGFNRDINIRFHYNGKELDDHGMSEGTIQVKYLDNNSQWQVVTHVTLDTVANTISINQNSISAFYALTASSIITSAEISERTAVPEGFVLLPNFPNPFNPRTTIQYRLSKGSNMSLKIYDLNGRKVKQLYNGYQEGGAYSTVWNGTDEKGQIGSSGIYLIQFQAGHSLQVRKMTFLK